MYDYKATYSLVLTYNLQIMHNYSHNRETLMYLYIVVFCVRPVHTKDYNY